MLISLLRGRALLCQLFFEIFSGFSPRSPQPREHRHSVRDLVAQRVYGLALGYEDLNDHDDLRKDSTLALLVGKRDLTGERRVREQDR
ncbi:transposase, partial [Thiolapillus sp.]